MTNFHFQTNRLSTVLQSHMSGVLLTGHGGFDKLSYRSDLTSPKPGANEVIVRITCASVNNTDVNMRQGWYSKSVTAATDAGGSMTTQASDTGWGGGEMSFPRIQGADGVGQIVEIGQQVDSNRLGQRVLLDPILRPTPKHPKVRYLGSDCDGTFAEYVNVPSDNAIAIQSSLSDEELAAFPCAYLAALNLIERAQVLSGETVVVTGASGGVGTAALELALLYGAKVIGVVHPSKLQKLADDTRITWVNRLEPLSHSVGENQADVIIDVVGGSIFGEGMQCLRPGGRYAVAGAIGGPIVPIDLRTLYLKDLSLFGCTIPPVGLFQKLVQYIESGKLKPSISATFRLSEMVRAQEQFLVRAHHGKIIIKI